MSIEKSFFLVFFAFFIIPAAARFDTLFRVCFFLMIDVFFLTEEQKEIIMKTV